jgi:hypothetical protein
VQEQPFHDDDDDVADATPVGVSAIGPDADSWVPNPDEALLPRYAIVRAQLVDGS